MRKRDAFTPYNFDQTEFHAWMSALTALEEFTTC